MRIRIRFPHKTKRKKVKSYFDFNIRGRLEEVKRRVSKKHPVEYGPCELCGSMEGKLHTGEPCLFICDGCEEIIKKWNAKKKLWKTAMAKAKTEEESKP